MKAGRDPPRCRCPASFIEALFRGKAGVKLADNLIAVEMAPDDYQLVHPVAYLGIPVAAQVGIAGHKDLKILLGSGRKPLTGLGDALLSSGLFEDVAHIGVFFKIAQALGADYLGGPSTVAEKVKAVEREGTAGVIYKGGYPVFIMAVFLIFIMVVMMMVVVMVIMLIVIIVMMMLIVVIVVVMVVVIVIMLLLYGLVNLAYPCGRCGGLVKIEEVSVENIRQVNVAEIAIDNSCRGLDGADCCTDSLSLLRGHLRDFIEENNVAELHLADHKTLDIVIVDIGSAKGLTEGKLVAQTQGVDHRGYTVEADFSSWYIELGHSVYALRDRLRLTHAACLYDKVVKTSGSHYIGNLTDEVFLERAADAAVLEGDKRGVVKPDYTSAGHEVGIDVYLAEVVDDDGEACASAVVEYAVKQRGLSAAEVAGDQ